MEAKSKQDSPDDSDSDESGDRKWNAEGLIYSFYCVLTGSLYLLAFIKVPYLNFKVRNASFFEKYQLIRMIFSILILIVLFFVQLIMQKWYYNWFFLTYFVVFVVHFASFYYFVKFDTLFSK